MNLPGALLTTLLFGAVAAGAGAVIYISGPWSGGTDAEQAVAETTPADPQPTDTADSPPGAGAWSVEVFTGGGNLREDAPASNGGFVDGPAAVARFNGPTGIAIDGQGTIIMADARNSAIRAVDRDGSVSTLAGTGQEGVADGPAAEATFRVPVDVDVGPDGSIYVADSGADMIRRITPDGRVETVAGIDYVACDPGTKIDEPATPTPEACLGPGLQRYRDGPIETAVFNQPSSVLVSPAGDLIYVCDAGNFAIRVIDLREGRVTTLAGNGQPGIFSSPTDLAWGPDGNLLVTDGKAIRRITPDGEVSTVVRSDQFKRLAGLTIHEGQIWVTDAGLQQVFALTDEGQPVLIAGKGEQGFAVGTGDEAQFSLPQGIVSHAGRIYVADWNLNRVFVVERAP